MSFFFLSFKCKESEKNRFKSQYSCASEQAAGVARGCRKEPGSFCTNQAEKLWGQKERNLRNYTQRRKAFSMKQ